MPMGKNRKTKGGKYRVRYDVDTKWFEAKRLEAGYESLRSLARAMRVDVAILHRILTGRQSVWDYAAALSVALHIAPDTILERAGQPMVGVRRKDDIPIEGTVGPDLAIVGGPGRVGARTAPLPVAVATLKALRLRMANSALEALDMGVAYYRDRQALPPVDEFLGRVCVVRVRGRGDEVVRLVRRGTASGRFSLYDLAGGVREEDVSLDRASPVELVKL